MSKISDLALNWHIFCCFTTKPSFTFLPEHVKVSIKQATFEPTKVIKKNYLVSQNKAKTFLNLIRFKLRMVRATSSRNTQWNLFRIGSRQTKTVVFVPKHFQKQSIRALYNWSIHPLICTLDAANYTLITTSVSRNDGKIDLKTIKCLVQPMIK